MMALLAPTAEPRATQTLGDVRLKQGKPPGLAEIAAHHPRSSDVRAGDQTYAPGPAGGEALKPPRPTPVGASTELETGSDEPIVLGTTNDRTAVAG